ncbi:uncharacterized protein LAJ45_03176 [Morchella importuna]|uniref:NADH:flavin oxidoreductase/NADH oxidase n=1 Tax=Morchella conica CCBAS932 TaxID=1392247 RepID=A0A3N4KQU9_9PEZI|nr:uncharacterized protein LAJ45_03176 [Morchella importuna]KAH8152949.1 hypothetical protein LAJ45_03176 [Morchella importuna]RPB12954.1 NADH:flavin oxidoreductase/NADH oxidase [Morchella conica CCBAS932]
MSTAIDILSTPVTLPCGLVVPNRIVKGPMAENLSSGTSHHPNDLLNTVYRIWGEGQYGMLVTGNVQVDPRFLGGPGDVTFSPSDLKNPVALSAWKIWAHASQDSGTPTIVQLCHPGRQSPFGAGTSGFFTKNLAPSAVGLDMKGGFLTKVAQALLFGTPKEMTLKDIDEVVEMFVNGARMSYLAGFKGVQLHAAHGYLITQFLSPKINRRTDAYGGTPENRLRFILRIIEETRRATSPEFCIGVKLNSSDYQSMGITDEEVLGQVAALDEAGVDFIDISGGTYEDPRMAQESSDKPVRESTKLRESFFQEFSEKARKAVKNGCVIMVTGGFRSRVGMAAAVTDGACELVGIARPACLIPDVPKSVWLNKDLPDEEAVVKAVKIKGGKWVSKLPIVGVGMQSLWHGMQIGRIAVGKKPDLDLKMF